MMWGEVHTDEGLIGLGESRPRLSFARRVFHDTLVGLEETAAKVIFSGMLSLVTSKVLWRRK